MPVHVKCPGCSTVLAAPESAAGTVLSCPQCRNQFLVPGAPAPAMAAAAANVPPAASKTTAAAAPMLAPPAPPMSAGGKTSGSPSGTMTANVAPPGNAAIPPAVNRTQFYPPGHNPLPPTMPPNPPAINPSSNPVSPPGNSASANRSANAYPPGMVPAVAGPPPVSPTQRSSSPTAPPVRQSQAAKFVAADATATKIDLGAEGRLPSLQLEELDEDEEPVESQNSNPWVMIGVLGFSIAASVAMLFFEPSVNTTQQHSKLDLRGQIKIFYLPTVQQMESGAVAMKPYQKKLRDGLLAFDRGNLVEENRCYREVLSMLQMEGKNEFTGLTGNARGDVPPNDSDLETILSALVSGR